MPAAVFLSSYGIWFQTQAELNAAIATNGGLLFTGPNLHMSPTEALSRWPNAKLVQGGGASLPTTGGDNSFPSSIQSYTDAAIPISPVDPGLHHTVLTGATYFTPATISPSLRVNPVTSNVYVGSNGLADRVVTDAEGYIQHNTPLDITWDPVFLPAAIPITATQAANFTGTFDVQIVSWTGDGTSNRLIPTTLALNTGVVAVWIEGGTVGVIDSGCFRANHASMNGTLVIGFGVGSIQTTAGIMSFAAGGFTVTAGSVAGAHFANFAGNKYTAIVLRDTTSDNRYLHTGRYTGNGTAGKVVTVAGTCPVPLSHVWVWGRAVAYRSTADMSGDLSTTLANEANPNTGVITSIGTTNFVLGTNNNVNSNLGVYDYMALSVDALFTSKHVFGSTKVTGTGSFPIVASFPFAPSVAFARQSTTGGTGAYWRGPDHVTTGCNFAANGGSISFLADNGIVAIGALSMSLGSSIAVSGFSVFAWAWKAGTVDNVVVGTSYTVTPPASTFISGPPPNIVPPELGGAGAGCSATLAPGLDTSGVGSEGLEE